MKLCFIDEAGDLQALPDPPQPNSQPVLVVGSLFVDEAKLYDLTHALLHLKLRYFPRLNYRSDKFLDSILPEIKGSDLRKNATRGNAKQRKHAFSFLDRILGLLHQYDARAVDIQGCGSGVWMSFSPQRTPEWRRRRFGQVENEYRQNGAYRRHVGAGRAHAAGQGVRPRRHRG